MAVRYDMFDLSTAKVTEAVEALCPVCGTKAFYVLASDHCYHYWGEDNIKCWQKMLKGQDRPFQGELERVLDEVRNKP